MSKINKIYNRVISFVLICFCLCSALLPCLSASAFDSAFVTDIDDFAYPEISLFSTSSDSSIYIDYTIDFTYASFPNSEGGLAIDWNEGNVTTTKRSAYVIRFNFDGFNNWRTNHSEVPTHRVSFIDGRITPNIDLSNYNLDNYTLRVAFNSWYSGQYDTSHGISNSEKELILADNGSFGISDFACPKFYTYSIDDTRGFTGFNLTSSSNNLSWSFSLDSSSAISNLLSGKFSFVMPFLSTDNDYADLQFVISLVPKPDQSSDSSDSSPSEPDPDPDPDYEGYEKVETVSGNFSAHPADYISYPTQSNSIELSDLSLPTFTTNSPDSSGSYYTLIKYDETVVEERASKNGQSAHYWSLMGVRFNPTNTYDVLGSAEYAVKLDWKFNYFSRLATEPEPGSEISYLNSNINSFGISGFKAMQIGGSGFDVSTESTYVNNITTMYMAGSVFVTNANSVYKFLTDYIDIRFPFCASYNNECTMEFKVTLYKKTSVIPPASSDSSDSSSSSHPDIPDDPNAPVFDVLNPSAVGPYDFDFHFLDVSTGMDASGVFTVSDYFSTNDRYSFRDYTSKFAFLNSPVGAKAYDELIAIGYADGVSTSDFSSSLAEHFTVNLPYQIDGFGAELTDCDSSLLGFEATFYFQADYIFLDYLNLIKEMNTQYFGFEPFCLTVGDTRIPFDYFKIEYRNDTDTLRATLKLDGANAADRMFINALRSNNSGTARFEFTLSCSDLTNGNSIMFGIMRGGFKFLRDPSTGQPVDSSGSGGTFDSDRYYQLGYNQGISDGSDKNYVFGFVNGCFSAVNTFYHTLADGISIGGISLGAIITSIVIIVVLAFVIKWLL